MEWSDANDIQKLTKEVKHQNKFFELLNNNKQKTQNTGVKTLSMTKQIYMGANPKQNKFI